MDSADSVHRAYRNRSVIMTTFPSETKCHTINYSHHTQTLHSCYETIPSILERNELESDLVVGCCGQVNLAFYQENNRYNTFLYLIIFITLETDDVLPW